MGIMNIIIIGDDGRTNALKWHFDKYGHNVVILPETSLETIVNKVHYSLVDLFVLVRVEDSANGLQQKLVDVFGSHKVFACNKEASRFETDKKHGIEIAHKCGLSVPRTTFADNIQLIEDQLSNLLKMTCQEHDPETRYVIKKTGLACGQGVKIVNGAYELGIFLNKWSGVSGTSMVVQEYKEGVEISGRVLCQQGKIIPLWMTMEHKHTFNDDRGPFCAEMGTVVLAGVGTTVMKEIQKLEPWLREVDYTGMLDINFIMDDAGNLWFVEPTCRFGDPETEIALTMLNCDFARIAAKACRGVAVESDIVFAHKAAVGVVIAGGGYPYLDACLQGMPIELPPNSYPHIFIMGAENKNGQLVTKGGRHLVVVGTGEFVEQARSDAYRIVRSNRWFLDAWYRTDIGAKWEDQFPALCINGIILNIESR